MNINSLSNDESGHIYHSPSFKNVLEQHIEILQVSATINEVTAEHARVYPRDFYGMLSSMRIPFKLHWLTLRLNRMTSPHQWRGKPGGIVVPNLEEVDRLLGVHLSTATG